MSGGCGRTSLQKSCKYTVTLDVLNHANFKTPLTTPCHVHMARPAWSLSKGLEPSAAITAASFVNFEKMRSNEKSSNLHPNEQIIATLSLPLFQVSVSGGCLRNRSEMLTTKSLAKSRCKLMLNQYTSKGDVVGELASFVPRLRRLAVDILVF